MSKEGRKERKKKEKKRRQLALWLSSSEAHFTPFRLYQFNRPVFAKLAAQCATVSSSSTTLYGRTSVAHANGDQEVEVKKKRGIPFRELNETEVQTIRESIFGVGE